MTRRQEALMAFLATPCPVNGTHKLKRDGLGGDYCIYCKQTARAPLVRVRRRRKP